VAADFQSAGNQTADAKSAATKEVALEKLSILIGLLILTDALSAQEIVTLKGHHHTVAALAFSPDGKILASGSWDKTIQLWQVPAGKMSMTLTDHTDWVHSLAFSMDGKNLVSASPREFKIWDLKTHKEIATQPLPGNIYSMVISADAKRLAFGRRDGTVQVWDISSRKLINSWQAHKNWVSAVALSRDGMLLASASRDGEVRIWQAATGKDKIRLAGHAGASVNALAFTHDGKTLASGCHDATIKLWDLETGKEKATLTGHKGMVLSLAFTADGKYLASGERHGIVRLWNVENSQVRIFPGHPGGLGFSVIALAFSPDGQILASAGYDKTVKLWNCKEK
jgi:WD40 repeat protein